MTQNESNDISASSDGAGKREPHPSPQEQPRAHPAGGHKLPGLMAEKDAATVRAFDRGADAAEQEAQAVAEQALAAGEQALQQARQQLRAAVVQPRVRFLNSERYEQVLRALLVLNFAAMMVVVLSPTSPFEVAADPDTQASAAAGPLEAWDQALRAAERRDWPAAVTILEEDLDRRPNMVASERLNVLSALSFYAARKDDFAASRGYARRARAMAMGSPPSSSLTEEIEDAIERGDQDSLRRAWSRAMLQGQRLPGHLFHRAAHSLLALGARDRSGASVVAGSAEFKASIEQLRAEGAKRVGGK